MRSKAILSLFFLFAPTAVLFAQNNSAEKNKGFAVVELFTSQGCNTCPPADKLLSEVIADARKNKKPVYALSFHVDYWNRLGWKDPYSSFAFSKRQNNYVSAGADKEVYTPQVYINGKTSFTGSDKKRMFSEIEKELKTASPIIFSSTKGTIANDTLLLNFSSSKTDKNYSLVVALVQRGLVTKIGKGENAGKTLAHDNVVRVFEIYPLATKSGTVKFPLRNFKPDKTFSLIAYVQQKQTKQILAATGFDF